MSDSVNGLVKILFVGPTNGLPLAAPESMWALPVDEESEPAVFEVRNSPFYIKGVSFRDRVHARQIDGFPGAYEFIDIAERGGHSTYRIIPEELGEPFEKWWAKVAALGCTYESSNNDGFWLYAVDVPPSADIHKAYNLMMEAEDAGVWQFEEGHCSNSACKPASGI